MTSFLKVLICSLAVLGGGVADTISLEGRVGGEVQITCSHSFAQSNVKYFCNKTCSKKHTLIKSKQKRNPNTQGRYRLFDEGTGVFTVTISGLKKSDSGTYWCGVERIVADTHFKVILTVLEAPEPTLHTTPRLPGNSTSEETVKTIERRTESGTSSTTTRDFFTTTETTNPPDNRQLIYIGSGLACLVLICVICLFILIKQTKKRTAAIHKAGKAQPNWNKQTNPEKDLQIPTKTNQQKASSANQRTPPSRRPPPDPSSSIYSNITPQSPDALNYSTVNFTSQSEDIHYSTIIFIRERESHTSKLDSSSADTTGPSASLYSPINLTDSSHSTENANAVIYSTIRTES